jgi:hypothetical protein
MTTSASYSKGQSLHPSLVSIKGSATQREASHRDSRTQGNADDRPRADEYCTTSHVGFTIIVD